MWKIEKMTEELETKDNVDLVKARIEAFANIEHIDRIQTILLPKVENFSGYL